MSKVRIHKDLRRTVDFLDAVVGPAHARHIDFLTIHPRTRRTPASDAIDLDALRLLTDRYGDVLPILVSGDVFALGSLPFSSSSPSAARDKRDAAGEEEADDTDGDALRRPRPEMPKLAGLMSARGILANPALYAGAERCPWEAVQRFMTRVVRAPLSVKLVLHHLTEMTGPGMGPDKRALLSRRERAEMMGCATMCDLVDFLDAKVVDDEGRRGLRRDAEPCGQGG